MWPISVLFIKKKWVRNMWGTYCLNGQEKIASLVSPGCLFSATLWSHWSRETPIFDQYATKINSQFEHIDWISTMMGSYSTPVEISSEIVLDLPGLAARCQMSCSLIPPPQQVRGKKIQWNTMEELMGHDEGQEYCSPTTLTGKTDLTWEN